MKSKLNQNQPLNREVGLFSATVVVIANMIGTGIFTTSGFIMAQLPNPMAFQLCWLLGGLFALCGALCYGELGVRFPFAGGEYIYLRQTFGRCLAFLSGWISLIVGFSAPIAAAAMACVAYLFPDAGAVAPIIACLIILCLTLLHYHSLMLGTRVQNALTLFKVAILIGFIFAAILFGHGDVNHLSTLAAPDTPWWHGNWAVALVFVSFAYSGWNAAAYLGGEIKAPRRNLPRALVIGTLIVMALYLALNTVFIYALSPALIHGQPDIGAIAATALFTPAVGRWFGIAIAIGLLSVLSAMIMTGPRVYFAMARDGLFFKTFGQINATHRTPAASIFLQAAIAILMVLSARFDQLLIYIGFTLSLSSIMTVIGLLRERHRTPLLRGSYRTPLYPLVPAIFILGNTGIVLFTLYSQPTASLTGLGTIGLGLVAFRIFCHTNSLSKLKPVSETTTVSPN